MAESGSLICREAAGPARVHLGGFVSVVLVDIPTAKDERFQRGERNEIFDARRAAFGAFAEADGAELRERADGLTKSVLNGLHSGDKSRVTAPMPGIRIPSFP